MKGRLAVSLIQNHCLFETRCPGADALLLCGDCIGCFAMQSAGADRWVLTLGLPPGVHHVRYYARFGDTLVLQGEDDAEVLTPRQTGLFLSRSQRT